MQAPPSDREMRHQTPHHNHSNEGCRECGTNGCLGCQTALSSPGASAAQKPELPPPTSPTDGIVIAPLPETSIAPYGPLNKTIVLIFKGGRCYEIWGLDLGGQIMLALYSMKANVIDKYTLNNQQLGN